MLTRIIESVAHDVRDSWRAFCKHPGTVIASVVVLALAIGGTTAASGLVKGVLLDATFADAHRLVHLGITDSPQGGAARGFSFPRWTQLSGEAQSFVAMGAYADQYLNLTGVERPEQLKGARISAGLLGALEIAPVTGRVFTADEDWPNVRHVALISERLWSRRFGRETSTIGTALRLDDTPYTVIGVLPSTVQVIFEGVDVWVSNVRALGGLTDEQIDAGAGYLRAIGRLRQDVTVAQARAEMDVLNQRYQAAYAGLIDAAPGVRLLLTPLQEMLVRNVRPTLLILSAAMALVLLIACATVANLLTARAAARATEVAVRLSLGASPVRITRQLLIEGLTLGLAAGVGGAALAAYATDLVLTSAWDAIAPFRHIRLDWTLFSFALLISLATGVVVGVMPAVQVRASDLSGTLRGGSRSTASPTRVKLRDGLVVAQLVLSLVLVIGTGLAVKSLLRLRAADPGFDAANVLTLRVELPATRYPEAAQQRAFFNRLVTAVDTLAGVRSAAVALNLPLRGRVLAPVLPDGHPVVPVTRRPLVFWQATTPGYFHTLGIKVLRGREFTEADDERVRPVCMVNEAASQRFWPNVDPVGKWVRVANDELRCEVIGEIANVKTRGLDGALEPEIYTPYAQRPWKWGTLVVRGETDPRALETSISALLARLDPDLPVTNVRTMDEIVQESLGNRRLLSLVLAGFAALATVLAIIGIYSTMTYWVSERAQDIGVRVLMGAAPRDILWLVLSRAGALIFTGVAIGMLAASALSRFMTSVLYGVSPHDPSTIAGAGLLFFGLAMMSVYGPVRQATRVDPIMCIRATG